MPLQHFLGYQRMGGVNVFVIERGGPGGSDVKARGQNQ
jgi:hypothetical protein